MALLYMSPSSIFPNQISYGNTGNLWETGYIPKLITPFQNCWSEKGIEEQKKSKRTTLSNSKILFGYKYNKFWVFY